ncbi:MAG TPA: ATP-binding protein [Phycisphaerae bacterium]|nr:ATP-binding protein [Phycisphaerae bacterium]
MSTVWSRFKQFWLAEEVPRWMGFSLVFLFTAGLAAAGWAAFLQARDNGRRTLEATTAHSLRLFGQVVAGSKDDDLHTLQVALREFAANFHCSQLRVFNRERQVVASIQSDEIGEPNPFDSQLGTLFPRRLEVLPLPAPGDGPGEDGGLRLFRMPIDTGDSVPRRFVEGVFVAALSRGETSGNHAGTLAVVLTSVGVLLLLYRRMRQHFQGISRIAGKLAADPETLAGELESLRVADSLGSVAQTWNKLIDLIEEFRAESKRTAASDELRRALESSCGGTGGELAKALNALPDGLLYITDPLNGPMVRFANAMARRLLGCDHPTDEGHPGGQQESEGVVRWGPRGIALDEVQTGPLGKQLVETITATRCGEGNTAVFEPAVRVIETETDGSSYRVRVLPLTRSGGGAPGSGGCVVVVADVSQQVRADRAREDFVSQVTHELRTPLTNIRAYAETLSSGMFDNPQVITECYNVITKETRRLSRLIEDILSISQMEAGSIELVIDDVDVRTLVSDAVRDVRGLADEKDIDLQMKLPSKLGTLQGDRDKLAVVLNNLLGNALKYTPSGGSVHLGCTMDAGQFTVTVKDSGIGVAPSDQERIFEKFQRASDPEVQNQTGTGIGLTTAREIVRRHGGDIELMSVKGEGSTFVIKIPVLSSGARTRSAGLGVGV